MEEQHCLDRFSIGARGGAEQDCLSARLTEKSIIIHKDENGFGLRIKGQAPVFVEHVHENGAAWRAGVRALDLIDKVNGFPVGHMDHKDVVLAFKSCNRFVALTLIGPDRNQPLQQGDTNLIETSSLQSGGLGWLSRQPSTYSKKVYQFFNRPDLSGASIALNQRRMSTATNYSVASTSTVPVMDRTNSCRSAASAIQTNTACNQATKFTFSHADYRQQQQQQHSLILSRQASVEAQTGRDKRVAICVCSRNAADGHQRTLPGPCAHCEQANQDDNLAGQTGQEPRDAPLISCYTIPRDSGQQQVNRPTSKKLAPSATSNQIALMPDAQMGSQAGVTTTLAAANKISQSASVNSLAGIETHNACNNPPAPSNKLPASEPDKRQPPPKALASLSPPQTQATGECKRPPVVNKRVEIIREFIDTERTHTERLRCLNELFYRPLKQTGYMSVEQLRTVFSCHRTLYKIHRQIYRILMSANYDAYSEPLIGSALLEIFEGDLKRRLERASCTFCSAQATNIELLNKMTRRDTKTGEFLAQVTSQRMVGRLGVKDLLASCFQRLTKYPLLLESLLKATPEELPEDPEAYDADYGGRRRTMTAPSRFRGAHEQAQKPDGRHHHRRSQRSHLRLNQSMSDEPDGEEDDDEEEVDDEYVDYDYSSNWASERGANSNDDDDDDEAERLRLAQLEAAEEARRNSRRIMAISLAEEREFIERALQQSRQILVRVNDSIKVAIARNRLKEIWKRTDKYPDVPLNSIDITKQQVIHEGLLTLRLSKRSFDVYVLLLNDYIIILTREGQDKYRLKFFTPEGKSPSFQSSAAATSSTSSLGAVGNILGNSSASPAGASSERGAGGNSANMSNLSGPYQTVYSPIFVIDEHLTTRDAATDENGFYLLCKRKDDCRIYEFASRSPAERSKWRDKIQTAIERQISRQNRRPSYASTLTKSSSEISANEPIAGANGRRNTETGFSNDRDPTPTLSQKAASSIPASRKCQQQQQQNDESNRSRPSTPSSEPTKIVGTISYVIDDGIVLPSKMESSRVFVDQAIQVNILDGSTMRGQMVAAQVTS